MLVTVTSLSVFFQKKTLILKYESCIQLREHSSCTGWRFLSGTLPSSLKNATPPVSSKSLYFDKNSSSAKILGEPLNSSLDIRVFFMNLKFDKNLQENPGSGSGNIISGTINVAMRQQGTYWAMP